ncbi:MAG TPA: alpha-L-arabinofuranosidase C-terminal domain-containing protein [Vicinamibacteria bacterium]|nr:alpha-L-arabinofuranosidase C-terminal domain-containing protein [Vicinamibacteria bacterium]
MQRRAFLETAAGAGLGALAGSRSVLAAEAEIELAPGRPGPVISPHIYGHFIEHLGGVIYDGIWVGRGSKIANVDGIRQRFVDDMKRIGAPNLRWPGGCFADGYHWRDGIGPADKRPRTYNFWEPRMPPGVRATETNQFGTHEFMRLCRLVGAEPYVAANVGSSTPQEFYDWVAYCNAPPGTASLADERARNGAREPFAVKYWGVGNESWGCGGNMTGAEYATEFRKFVAQFPMYTRPYLVAVGPRGHSADGDPGWTEGFFEGLGRHRARVDGYALHYYTDFRQTPEAGAAFDEKGWYAVLHKGARIENVVEDHWRLMGRHDPEHHTKFVIDEWGNWYRGGTELGPAYLLSQTITLRDALHAAMTFDIFNRHAEKIEMANVAQTINCLHSLFAAVEDRYTRTPAYYAFEMYRPHMGARLVPMRIEVPELAVPLLAGSATLAGLSGSASIRDRRVTVTLTNPSVSDAVTARIRVSGGGRLAEGRGTVLTHEEMTATNTFDDPDNVTLSGLTVRIGGDAAQVTVPKQAAVALELRIA